jgi:alpha-ketoglutarate-dependent taurine dioxygenase
LTDLLPSTLPDVRPIAGRIGAEIHGLDISQPLDERTVAGLRDAVLQHRVIFFRNQTLDDAAQVRFGRAFGELTYAHPFNDTPPDGFPEIHTVDARRGLERYGPEHRERLKEYGSGRFGGWHTDVTPAVNPPWGSILRADVVPEHGGDTSWTNLVSAYQALSAPLQRLADGLRAEHRYGLSTRSTGKLAERIEANSLVANHPVVRVHPETGEKALYVSPGFTSHILGVSPSESRRLLDLFFEELTKPEHTVRFRWQPGDVAFWDNRSTAHQAPRDIDKLDVERVLTRVTLLGDVPVGPDGRPSELVEGRPFGGDWEVAVAR